MSNVNQSDQNDIEIKRRIQAIQQEADKVSEAIRNAESLLKQVPAIQDVNWAYLTWDHKAKRILSKSFDGSRPLIECPLKERISRQSEINGLIDAVLMSSESFIEKMRAEK